jgi:hypothetical protein
MLTLPETLRTEAILAYVKSVDKIFLICVPAGGLSSLGAL